MMRDNRDDGENKSDEYSKRELDTLERQRYLEGVVVQLTAELAQSREREKALSAAVAEITGHRLHQSKEINRLTKVENDLVSQIEKLHAEKPCDLYYIEMIASFERELAALREALGWYANPRSYRNGIAGEDRALMTVEPCVHYWRADNGEKARAALASTAPKEGE